MRTVLKGLLLAWVVLSLTGCAGVTGHWTLESFKPETEKGNFQMGMMCLTKDGGYVAAATEGGKTEKMTGTYKYDAKTHALTFVMEGGKERTYTAQVLCPGDKLKVTEAGKDWVAMMKRGQCCDGKQCGDKMKCCCDMSKCGQCPMNKEAGKAEPKKADAGKAEPKKTDAGKAEPKKTEPAKPRTELVGGGVPFLRHPAVYSMVPASGDLEIPCGFLIP